MKKRLLLGLAAFAALCGCAAADAGAVGIIGGADGPTSVYLYNRTSPVIPVVILLVLAGVGVIVYLRCRKKK